MQKDLQTTQKDLQSWLGTEATLSDAHINMAGRLPKEFILITGPFQFYKAKVIVYLLNKHRYQQNESSSRINK